MTSMSRRHLAKVTTAAAIASASTRVAPATRAQNADRPTLIFGINASDVQSLDPHYASGSQDRALVDMMFNGLVRFTPGDSSTLEPDLAEDMPTPSENADGTQTWTFVLRSGIKTHPYGDSEGDDLTPDDALFSFQKAADEASSGFAGDYAGWRFAIGDDGNFEITVPEPISDTLFLPKVANYSGGYIIPKAAYEAVGADAFVTNPVGTGPFSMASYNPQVSVELTAFDDFYRGAPQLAGVDVRFLNDPTSRELALQSGDVHMIAGLPETQWVNRINELDGIVAEIFGVNEVHWINLDIQHPILKDERVREAITLGIDRANHAAIFGDAVASPVYAVTGGDDTPGGLGEQDAQDAGLALTADGERARTLLSEAGHPEGFELDLVASEMDEYRTNYEVLAEELRQIGITVNLEMVQHAAMHELIRQGRNPLVIYVGFRPTADTYLSQFWSTDGGVTNFSHFTVDDLRDQARAETDADAQSELWKQANIEIQTSFAGMGLIRKGQVYARIEGLNYGHDLVSVIQYYPGIDETTTLTL